MREAHLQTEDTDMENVVVVKKKHTVWKVVAIVAAVAALCLIAAKVYQKFFKNKKCSACDAEVEAEAEVDAIEAEEGPEAVEEAFEASADAVIANAEEMEESAEN